MQQCIVKCPYFCASQRRSLRIETLPFAEFQPPPIKEAGCQRNVTPGPALPTPSDGSAYETFTSMDFGRAFSLLARRTVSTPSLNSAPTFASSASSGTLKLRVKLP